MGHGLGRGDVKGPEGQKQLIASILTAFSDYNETIDDLIAEGDKVAGRFTITGTHTGNLMGVAPTGKRVTLTGNNIYRIVGGRIVEAWGMSDRLGMMQQIGIIPSQF